MKKLPSEDQAKSQPPATWQSRRKKQQYYTRTILTFYRDDAVGRFTHGAVSVFIVRNMSYTCEWKRESLHRQIKMDIYKVQVREPLCQLRQVLKNLVYSMSHARRNRARHRATDCIS